MDFTQHTSHRAEPEKFSLRSLFRKAALKGALSSPGGRHRRDSSRPQITLSTLIAAKTKDYENLAHVAMGKVAQVVAATAGNPWTKTVASHVPLEFRGQLPLAAKVSAPPAAVVDLPKRSPNSSNGIAAAIEAYGPRGRKAS